MAFSRRFGPLQLHVLRPFQLPEQPEVLVASNVKENGQPIGLGDAGHCWHSDLSYKPTPSLGSMLLAQELPAEGAATPRSSTSTWPGTRCRRNCSAVDGRLAKYEERRARNPWRPALTQAQIDAVAPVRHPVVRTHPQTGRRALFVGEPFTTRIVGLPQHESDALLQALLHTQRRSAGLPASLAGARHGVLGQPLGHPPGRRHPGPAAPAPAPHHHRRRRAVLSQRLHQHSAYDAVPQRRPPPQRSDA
ncbi:TauD/TfdA dioxygenase family protein [Xanthomonas theicola]|uniref:TauD/TfdA dioxygenase family protein n=1 Tax=Xanthomonas theicola TaxID=56464 RepID=UPI003CCDF08C